MGKMSSVIVVIMNIIIMLKMSKNLLKVANHLIHKT